MLKYELKKLIFNKSRLILLAVIFIIFTLMSLLTSSVIFEMRESSSYQEYLNLVSEYSGTLNYEQYTKSKKISEDARARHVAEYGKAENDLFMMNLFSNPVMKFHYDYANFGMRVHEYWNGPEHQDKSDIKGIYPIKEKLNTLRHKENSYEYKYYQKRLEIEISQGEPVFAYKQFWGNFFASFDISRIVFLLLITLAFFIAPVFTREIKDDMNSIILCSLKGRKEIVTAKLLSVCFTAAIITGVYFIGNFIGAFIANGNIVGFDAPIRCLDIFSEATIDTSIVGMALFGIIWTMFVAMVFGLFVCFISAYAKSQTSVFGLSIVFILTFAITGFLSDNLQAKLWPLVDFNYVTLSLFSIVFNGGRMYNFLGIPLSYGMVAFMACIVISLIVISMIYLSQRKRSVL